MFAGIISLPLSSFQNGFIWVHFPAKTIPSSDTKPSLFHTEKNIIAISDKSQGVKLSFSHSAVSMFPAPSIPTKTELRWLIMNLTCSSTPTLEMIDDRYSTRYLSMTPLSGRTTFLSSIRPQDLSSTLRLLGGNNWGRFGRLKLQTSWFEVGTILLLFLMRELSEPFREHQSWMISMNSDSPKWYTRPSVVGYI